MNAEVNLNWSGFFALLGSGAIVALIVLLIAYVQVWRHRIHRARRAIGNGPSPPHRIVRDVQPQVQSDALIQEYLDNAAFSNEGNPNFEWKERFRERILN